MKSDQLRDERGRQMQSHDIKRALGLLPEQKFHRDYTTATQIGNTEVRVLTIEDAKAFAKANGHPGVGKCHRVQAKCNVCGEWVSAGRMHQHYKGH